jgi:hypothetical protein
MVLSPKSEKKLPEPYLMPYFVRSTFKTVLAVLPLTVMLKDIGFVIPLMVKSAVTAYWSLPFDFNVLVI